MQECKHLNRQFFLMFYYGNQKQNSIRITRQQKPKCVYNKAFDNDYVTLLCVKASDISSYNISFYYFKL